MKTTKRIKTKEIMKTTKRIETKEITPFRELILRYKGRKPPKDFWGGITPKTVGFIFGLAKSGKTIVCENLALSIASGRTMFLGIPINLPRKKVLFISLEENIDTRIIQRGSKQYLGFSNEERKSIKENLLYSDKNFLRTLEDNDDWDTLENYIEKHKPNLLFIDSTNRLNTDIEKRKEANIAMQKIREFAKTYKCAIILIHHTNKSQKDTPITFSQMSGSSALSRDADLFIGVNSLSNGVRYIKFLENRYCQTLDKSLKFSIQDNYLINSEGEEYETEILKSIDKRYKSNNTETLLNFMKENLDKNDSIKTSMLMKHFVKDNGLLSKKTIYNQLSKLMSSNRIIGVKGKKGTYQITPENNDS